MAAEIPALASAAAPAPDRPGQATGLVVALEANFCRVGLEQPGPGGVDQLLCVRRTRLAKTGQQICVDGRYAAFGYVVDGFDVLEELGVDDRILRARVVDGGENFQAHA